MRLSRFEDCGEESIIKADPRNVKLCPIHRAFPGSPAIRGPQRQVFVDGVKGQVFVAGVVDDEWESSKANHRTLSVLTFVNARLNSLVKNSTSK
jgi:hypothetical protein